MNTAMSADTSTEAVDAWFDKVGWNMPYTAQLVRALLAERDALRKDAEALHFALHCASGDLMRLEELMADKYMPNIKRDVERAKQRIDHAIAARSEAKP